MYVSAFHYLFLDTDLCYNNLEHKYVFVTSKGWGHGEEIMLNGELIGGTFC